MLFRSLFEPSGYVDVYRTSSPGHATLVKNLPVSAAPGGDRDPGAAGMIGASPDGTILAYGGNVLGSDMGEPSDSVTVIDTQTGTCVTSHLPLDSAHPLRISAIWVNSADDVFASAWNEPQTQRAVVGVVVSPQVYRLESGRWIDTGVVTPSAAGGQSGWTGMITDEGRYTDFDPRVTGDLEAVFGASAINLAMGVTAFAWAPQA